jgi:hypothetical protein
MCQVEKFSKSKNCILSRDHIVLVRDLSVKQEPRMC